MKWIDVKNKLPTLDNLPDEYDHLWYGFNGNSEEPFAADVFCKLNIYDEYYYYSCFYDFRKGVFITCSKNNDDVTKYVEKWTLLPSKDI